MIFIKEHYEDIFVLRPVVKEEMLFKDISMLSSGSHIVP